MLLKIGRHPRVVRFLGQCVDGEDQLLITEFAPLGSLTDAFEKFGDRFTLAHSMVIMQQIAQAMEHLPLKGLSTETLRRAKCWCLRLTKMTCPQRR